MGSVNFQQFCFIPYIKMFYFITVPPLFVIEFLHRMMDIFEDYFSGECHESTIKENYVIVYEVSLHADFNCKEVFLFVQKIDKVWPSISSASGSFTIT